MVVPTGRPPKPGPNSASDAHVPAREATWCERARDGYALVEQWAAPTDTEIAIPGDAW